MIGKTNYRFRNWAGNEQSHPQKYFQPQSEEEIFSIVKEAADANKKIRVVGGGHSWSPIACSNDFLINLDYYNRVISIDTEKKQIRVQAGIRLKHLNSILHRNGLALVNLGSISEQSIAGATATGTHGTGIGFQILSSATIGMRVINGNGDTVEIAGNDPLLNAYRVSLGLLGIISEVTLQCTDAFNLKETSAPMLLENALERLPELLRDNHHVKFWWFPHVEYLMVYRYNRIVPGPATSDVGLTKSNDLLRWFNDVFLAQYFFAGMLRIGHAMPKLIPAINRFISNVHLKKIERVGKSYEIFNVPMPPKHRESEYAVPVEKAAQALRELRDEIDRNKMSVNFVTEIRFVKGDNIWMSPAYGRDSCYIGGYLYGDSRWHAYFNFFENIMKKHEGRPHWGKEFTPALHDFNKMYPMAKDFVKLMSQQDLNKRFGNGLTEKIISQDN